MGSVDPVIIGNATLYLGDCREVMRALEAGSVQTCITSPPYFGLRDYGHDGQIGLEPTPDEFVSKLVEVFREVRRVLRDDGTLWLNLGDSYAANRGYQVPSTLMNGDATNRAQAGAGKGMKAGAIGLKEKDLIGIPWRVAFALRDDGAASPSHMRDIERIIAAITDSYDTRAEWPPRIAAEVERLEREHIDANRGGWYLRQDIIWHKPNPMPESVRDRCTKAHEYIFLLSKSPRYYFDAGAIAEPLAQSSIERLSQPTLDQQAGSDRVPGKTNGRMKAVGPRFGGNKYGDDGSEQSRTKSGNEWTGSATGKRNKRSVWTVTTKPFKGAHFATFPSDLIEPCILAGCPEAGVVLDPFGGSGTTAEVAIRNGRSAVLCELNPDYLALQRERIGADVREAEDAQRQGRLIG